MEIRHSEKTLCYNSIERISILPILSDIQSLDFSFLFNFFFLFFSLFLDLGLGLG